jgi:hypothetical protein
MLFALTIKDLLLGKLGPRIVVQVYSYGAVKSTSIEVQMDMQGK